MIQPRFVDRTFPAIEPLDLLRINVQPDDVIARIGETNTCDKADVTGSDDGDAHLKNP